MQTSNFGDFSAQADAYSRARPGYPESLLDELIRKLPLRPGDPVADIGAGTGLFTRQLAARGLRITAIEPNGAMQRHAPELPGVVWQTGTFEATGLPDASQRWTVAAQAFHWADPAKALPELRRILRPAGHLTVLWNDRAAGENPVVDWTSAAIQRHAPGFDQSYRNEDWSAVLVSTGDFGDVWYQETRHVVPMSRQRYADLWRSQNHLAVAAGPEHLAAFLAELDTYLYTQRIETVDVPYLCRAWTARRR